MSISLHKTPGRVTTAAPPGRRAQLAAVVALIALVGVLAITAHAVITAAGDLLLALASVFLLAFSGWFVLTRRHLARLLGRLGGACSSSTPVPGVEKPPASTCRRKQGSAV